MLIATQFTKNNTAPTTSCMRRRFCCFAFVMPCIIILKENPPMALICDLLIASVFNHESGRFATHLFVEQVWAILKKVFKKIF
jgi:hypothetical protein